MIINLHITHTYKSYNSLNLRKLYIRYDDFILTEYILSYLNVKHFNILDSILSLTPSFMTAILRVFMDHHDSRSKVFTV